MLIFHPHLWVKSRNISRILYFFVIGDKAVLTHGFMKKTQNTPPKEIERAEKYRHQYLLQHQGE